MPETIPTIAKISANTGCQVFAKCRTAELPEIAVAMAAVVSLSKCFTYKVITSTCVG